MSENKKEYGAWELVEEPNTYDTYGNKCYHARCPECGFTWTNLWAVREHFKHCPGCGKDMKKENADG